MAPKGRDVNNPFEMLKNLGDMKDVKQILGEDFFKNIPLPQWQQTSTGDDTDPDTYPQIDLFERGQELIAVIELPGVESPAHVSLSIAPRSLYVKGAVPALPVAREGSVHIAERFHGPFEREIELPVRIDEQSAKASYAHGLLTVRMAKYQPGEGETEQFIPISFE